MREDDTTFQMMPLKDIGYVACQHTERLVLIIRLICSIEIHKSSIAEYEWPNGSYWVKAKE